MEQTLDISWETIIKVFVAGFIFYILFLVRDVVIWFSFALIISILLDPVIQFFQKFRLPRVIAVVFVYLAILGLFGLVIYLSAPIFIFEFKQFVANIPEYFERANPVFRSLGIDIARTFEEFTSGLVAQAQESSGSIIKAITVFFGGIASTAFIFTLAFFISLEEKSLLDILALLTPKKYEQSVVTIFKRAQVKVAGWFGVRVLACLFVGVLTYVAFLLLGVKYALILGIISGLLNFVPYIGPMVTWILTFLSVGVSNSWILAIYAILVITIIQEIENKFLTPLLMKKLLDLPPVLVLISLLVGGTIFGLLGTLFSVPVFGIIYETTKEFLEKKKQAQ